ncbi:hypothetical protein GE118_03335 [Mycoplasma sp. NEAQ87857]|uniref:hypothetical protein n=1 Tax=Mycoplasma sp. NEAQ87857 TaxID=2683967 RepID=UPI001316F685|nr:hypothetical protein [Mycoplasma sp. NEAQ87857]QGZ97822.1 hypothetical protein GE118_03335 [Mycoplasma sp. NEAQ87857]
MNHSLKKAFIALSTSSILTFTTVATVACSKSSKTLEQKIDWEIQNINNGKNLFSDQLKQQLTNEMQELKKSINEQNRSKLDNQYETRIKDIWYLNELYQNVVFKISELDKYQKDAKYVINYNKKKSEIQSLIKEIHQTILNQENLGTSDNNDLVREYNDKLFNFINFIKETPTSNKMPWRSIVGYSFVGILLVSLGSIFTFRKYKIYKQNKEKQKENKMKK